jgi:hypothetical protein
MADAPASLLPVAEGRLGTEVGLTDTILSAAFEPLGAGPLHAASVGEDLEGEDAVCAFCLFRHRHPADKELRKELWILRS